MRPIHRVETVICVQDPDRRLGRLTVSIGIVTICWLVFTSRWIFSGTVVPWDSKSQFYAFFRFLSATLSAGQWPFWNPYHYGGHPSIADPQSLLFYPVFVVWGALDPAPSMQAFDLVVFAHLLAGGIATVVIGWRTQWPVPACVLAAILFMFGGAASGRLQHTGIILSYGLFPLALLLLQIALERGSHLAAIAFAMVAGNVALGRSQVALLLCMMLVAAAAAEVLRAPRPLHYLRRRAGVIALMTAVGAGLLLVPILLTLQFAALSNRPAETLDDALKGSLYPANLATLAVPDIFGTHSSYWGPGAATLAQVALTDDSFNYLFVGSMPVLLVLWIGIVGASAWRPGRRLMTASLVIACLFMLGRYTPLYSLAFRFVPGIGLFRRPTDASFIFGISLSMLSAHCLADYVREGLPRLRWPYSAVAIGAVIAGALAIAGSAVAFSARTGHAFAAIRQLTLASTLMLAGMLIIAGARHLRSRLAAASLITFIAMAELLWWNAAFRLNAESRASYSVLEAPMGAEAAAIMVLEKALAEDHRRGAHPRIEVLGLGGAWQNLSMVRRWEAINGYNPLRIGIYDRLVAPGEENWNYAQRRFPPSFEGYESELAQALGLTYLVLGQPLGRMQGAVTPSPADLLLAGPPVWIYRLAGAMPRACLVSRIETEDPNAKPLGCQILDQPPANPSLPQAMTLPNSTSTARPSPGSGPVQIISSRTDHMEIMATSNVGGVLVLHDIYYPGWVADVDGTAVSISSINSLFRGIDLAPGRHRVILTFRPLSLVNLTDALKAATTRARP